MAIRRKHRVTAAILGRVLVRPGETEQASRSRTVEPSAKAILMLPGTFAVASAPQVDVPLAGRYAGRLDGEKDHELIPSGMKTIEPIGPSSQAFRQHARRQLERPIASSPVTARL